MDSEAEQFRMKHAGMVARSAQGHAAKGMKIKDQEDMWVNIQHNTFKNWMNVQLRDTGIKVEDLSEDLKDGVALVMLVETLQKRRLRKIKKVVNQHQALENVTTALNAIAEDGIKLVNIGNVDIVNGNLKLILGLVWSLIMHYQIGQTKFPPKKLMLSWLKAVLPGCDVNNFTNSWSSGVNLSALIDYCKPGLFRNWKHLDGSNSVQNCKRAMEIAHNEFNIPMVLEPEYLASPYLDDLSGMTYLSYFMKDGGPGYKATLDWVQKTLPEKNIKNFTTDWNDGRNLASLIKKLGGPVPGFKEMTSDPDKWESNLNVSLEGGKKLGVTPVLTAGDMAKPDVEYLGPMAYLAYYQWVRPRPSPTESIRLRCDVDNIRVNNPVRFRIDFLSKDIVVSELRVDVSGPTGPCRVDVDLGKRGARGSFLPKQVGFYEIKVTHEGESVDGSPIKVRALPDVSKIMFSGIDPCALGSIVEVLINSNGAGGGDIDVVAMSPTGRPLRCPVKEEDGVYTATFEPDEAGEWSIGVTYDDEHIQGSPFTCHVYDPNAIKVRDLNIATLRSPGKPFTFAIDASACGWGDAKVDVTHNGTSIPSMTLEVERSIYEVTFTPLEAAKYKIYVYFNGHEVRGSPFPLYLGVAKPPERKGLKSKKKKTKNRDKEVEPIIKEYTSVVDSPMNSRFNKIFDSSTSKSFTSSNKQSNLNKSYESKLDEINTSSKTRNLYSSSVNKSSILNRSSEDILSKNYNSPLETSALLKDPAERKLQFDLSQKTIFDLTPKRTSTDKFSSSSLNRRTSAGIEANPSNGLDSYTPTSTHLRNSSSIVDRSYNNDSSYLTNHNASFSSTKDSTFNSSSVMNTKREQRFTSSKDYSSRVNSSNNEADFRSERIRSSLSPELNRSPRSPKSFSPIQSPRESPLRQISPPANVPNSPLGLSAPLKVLMASQNGPKTSEEFQEYSESVVKGDDASEIKTIKTKTTIIKSEERIVSSSPPPSSPYLLPLSGSSSASSVRKAASPPSGKTPSPTSAFPPNHTNHYSASTAVPPPPNFSNIQYSSSTSSIREERRETHSPSPLTHRTYYSGTPTAHSPKPSESIYKRRFADDGDFFATEKNNSQASNTTTIDIVDSAAHRLQSRSSTFGSSALPEIDPRTVMVSGSGVRLVSVGQHAEVFVAASDKINEDNIHVSVMGPGKRAVPVSFEMVGPNEVVVMFKPLLVGEYFVDVRASQKKVPGSPFRCYVYDAKEIKVGRIPDGIVGDPLEFEIDGSDAGSGNLEILVNGGHVTSNVRNLGQQKFRASFVPHSAIRHSVEMRFNGESVTGSPWTINVMEGALPRVCVMGDAIRHFPAGQLSTFDISATNLSKEDIEVHIVSPAKRPVSYQLSEAADGLYRVSFATSEVGSYVVEVVVGGQKVQGSPFIAKAYDAGLIRVSDVPNGVVGQPCQFRVDASQAGEGQLEISINDGEVPNHVQVLGGGRCLVSFTPDAAKIHTIDIKFNGETVRGCPFVCRVSDTSRVSLTLRHLELIPVGQPAAFNIAVDGGGSAELTVTVRTPSHTTLPVRVSGSVRQGFTAEFTPVEVGAHTIIVNYNDSTVSGTPFTCKVYDASKVGVSHLPRGAIGKSLQFIVDASEAGEGNLEISISAAGRNIPTQVHPQGSARFAVSFIPLEAIDHIITISFNKEPVPGSPFIAKVQADPNRIVVSGQALAATAVGKTSFFNISNVTGSVEDVEVSVEGLSRKQQRSF